MSDQHGLAVEAQEGADTLVSGFVERFISYIGVMTANGDDRTAIMGQLFDKMVQVYEEEVVGGLTPERVLLLLTAAIYQLADAKMELAAVQIDGSRRGGNRD